MSMAFPREVVVMRIAQARIGASVALLGALAVGCARPATVPAGPMPTAQTGNSAQALAPGFTLSCAPGQRAVIRQIVSAGQPLTDVRCVVDEPAPDVPVSTIRDDATDQAMSSVPAAPGAHAVAAYDQPDALAQARPRPGVRTLAYRTDGDIVTYQPRSVRRASPRRTWQKSAVIIGSSAGVGAGVGAAIGGKKGALIGAAIGGGSAALWDQATRRR
jgi:hypothetical protein